MNFKTVQRIVECLTLLVFIVGIFWITYGSFLLKKSQELDDDQIDFLSFYKFFNATLVGFGCFLVLWSCLGFIATWKKNNFLLGVYNIGILLILILFLVLLLLSILFHVKLPLFIEDKDCTKQTPLKDLKQLNELSYEYLCQSKCKCLFKGNSSQIASQQITNFSSSEGEIQIQNCPIFKSDETFKKISSHSSLMKSLENSFQCSGFCSVNTYYVFSDVNKEQPTKDCKEEMLNYLNSKNIQFLVITSLISALFLFSLLCSCCLCCKKKEDTYY